MNKGSLYLVSVGPGSADLLPPAAVRALESSEVIVTYDLYLRWLPMDLSGKEIIRLPLTREMDRAKAALDAATQGRRVALLSSGDIGIYGMAPVLFDLLPEKPEFEVVVVPGISAANACASLLGAPLAHDFATLSLSDLLCPRETILARAKALAEADLVVAFYNVQSEQRVEFVYEVLETFLKYKSPETWCGVVKNAYREKNETGIFQLKDLVRRRFDMFSTVIIGNRLTRPKGRFLYTPRGYNPDNHRAEIVSVSVPQQAVWVFSGTSDGNALAAKIAAAGQAVVLSAATEYGREIAEQSNPGIPVVSGKLGVEHRRRLLRENQAVSIVDATHPYAENVSNQLIQLASDLSIPYARYERPATALPETAIQAATAREAIAEAACRGQRILLAIGSNELQSLPAGDATEWFCRVAPDPNSLRLALAAGIPRQNILAMQGPFDEETNRWLLRHWRIDCLVTKESGEAGGLQNKIRAAQDLGISIIVIRRPSVPYPFIFHTFEALLDWVLTENSTELSRCGEPQ